MARIVKIGDAGYQISEEEAHALEKYLSAPTGNFSLDKALNAARMTEGPELLPIHQAMVKAMRKVTAVGKDGQNLQQNYAFRGIDGVLNALGPALREAGVFVLPELLEIKLQDTRTTLDKPTREVTVRVRYTFTAEDGSSVSAVVPGESLDTSDKGTAKAMSVAYRIALLQIFALPTQEPTTDDDGQYHTRAGSKGLSRYEAGMARAMVEIPTDEHRRLGPEIMRAAFMQTVEFRVCLDEHDAWARPSNGEGSPTWGELYAARIAAEIAAIDTAEDGKWLFGVLQEAKMVAWTTTDGTTYAELMKRRRVELDARNAQALNTITEQILSASLDDLGENGPVLESIAAAHQSGRITEQHAADLGRLLGDRIGRLMREQNVAHDDGHGDVSD